MRAETKQIGKFKYTMTTMGAVTGRGVALRVARPFGALLGAMAVQGEAKSIERAIAGSISAAIAQLSEEDLAFVCDRFAEQTRVAIPDAKGKTSEWELKDVFDEHFSARYDDLVLFLKWGIELNRFFGDAAERIAQAMKAAKDKAPPASSSPTASTDGSTDSSSTSA